MTSGGLRSQRSAQSAGCYMSRSADLQGLATSTLPCPDGAECQTLSLLLLRDVSLWVVLCCSEMCQTLSAGRGARYSTGRDLLSIDLNASPPSSLRSLATDCQSAFEKQLASHWEGKSEAFESRFSEVTQGAAAWAKASSHYVAQLPGGLFWASPGKTGPLCSERGVNRLGACGA